jgi:hypothetical protein
LEGGDVMKEIDVFFYMSRKDLEQAIRTWLGKKGHGKRISGLDLHPISSEWVDGEFQAVWTNNFTSKEEWDQEEED